MKWYFQLKYILNSKISHVFYLYPGSFYVLNKFCLIGGGFDWDNNLKLDGLQNVNGKFCVIRKLSEGYCGVYSQEKVIFIKSIIYMRNNAFSHMHAAAKFSYIHISSLVPFIITCHNTINLRFYKPPYCDHWRYASVFSCYRNKKMLGYFFPHLLVNLY